MMQLARSPLFEPVLWQGSSFKILNETLLPGKVEYLAVDQVSQALDAVKKMKTRAFGQVLTFLYSGALVARQYRANDPEPMRARLVEMTQRFCDARPTFDFRGLGDCFVRWICELPQDQTPGPWIETQARDRAAQLVEARLARAKRAAEILPDPCRLLTHCNISGELVAVADYCKQMGKDISVVATETRPYLQGSRLTAWELSQVGVPVSLIPDCAVAQIMAKREINSVLVGTDRSAQNGDIINKVGTYPLALMAKEYGVPFIALVQDPGSLARGEDIRIEERPAAELLTFQGRPLIPEGGDRLSGRYPAFDITPGALISSLVGFGDLFTPESFRQRFQRDLVAPDSKTESAQYVIVYGTPKQENYAYLAQALKAEQGQSILVPEMRPQLWGAHCVAPELLRRNLPTTLISDNMMGTFFARGQIKRLYLFYTGLTGQGPRAICGSLLASRLAAAHHVPVELLEAEQPESSPPDRDVATFLGQRVSPRGVRIHPLDEEVIAWALLKEKQEMDSAEKLTSPFDKAQDERKLH